MIRIETIAEFDADGRFTGQTSITVSPGPHRVTVVVDEPKTASTQPTMIDDNGLLLLNIEPQDGADIDINRLIDADRELRLQQLLGGGHT